MENMNSIIASENIGLCIEEIIYLIEKERKKIENQNLLKICRRLGDMLSGNINPHYCHEVAESAVNTLIKRKYAKRLLKSVNPVRMVREVLKPISERIPTQTWRSSEQNAWQQFSTPPPIAYLLTYLLNMKKWEKVLEPSAGTGSLAVWTNEDGIKTYTNEIDPRRRILLKHIGFSPTSFNAEFIHDFLPPEISADCVLMNPPFSSNGGRTKNNSCKFGFRHVESALERLQIGGKFGIVLGEAGGLDTKTGNDFWRKLSEKVEVKAIIKIDGQEYYKNGTSVDINLIIGKKLKEPQKIDWSGARNKIINFTAATTEEAFEKALNLNLRLKQ
jgi:type I restriction-modification system DNA methylase subunit